MTEEELQVLVDMVQEGAAAREPGWYTAREIAKMAGRSTDPTRRKLQRMVDEGKAECKMAYVDWFRVMVFRYTGGSTSGDCTSMGDSTSGESAERKIG